MRNVRRRKFATWRWLFISHEELTFSPLIIFWNCPWPFISDLLYFWLGLVFLTKWQSWSLKNKLGYSDLGPFFSLYMCILGLIGSQLGLVFLTKWHSRSLKNKLANSGLDPLVWRRTLLKTRQHLGRIKFIIQLSQRLFCVIANACMLRSELLCFFLNLL